RLLVRAVLLRLVRVLALLDRALAGRGHGAHRHAHLLAVDVGRRLVGVDRLAVLVHVLVELGLGRGQQGGGRRQDDPSLHVLLLLLMILREFVSVPAGMRVVPAPAPRARSRAAPARWSVRGPSAPRPAAPPPGLPTPS